jgi:hypothetical protein
MACIGFFGLRLRSNLCVAISSNLSFVLAVFLAYSWHAWNSIGQVKAASLASVAVPTGGTFCLFAVLAAASFISFAVSHFLYFRALRSKT